MLHAFGETAAMCLGSKFAIGRSGASPLATGRDAHRCQRGFLFAAVGVGAAEWSSHAGAWILEVAIAFPRAAHSLKGLFQPR